MDLSPLGDLYISLPAAKLPVTPTGRYDRERHTLQANGTPKAYGPVHPPGPSSRKARTPSHAQGAGARPLPGACVGRVPASPGHSHGHPLVSHGHSAHGDGHDSTHSNLRRPDAYPDGRTNRDSAAAHAHPGQTGTLRAVCPTRASRVSLVAKARPSGGFRRTGGRLHRPQRRRDSTGPRAQRALRDARLWVDIGYRVLLRGPVGCSSRNPTLRGPWEGSDLLPVGDAGPEPCEIRGSRRLRPRNTYPSTTARPRWSTYC